MRSYYQRRLPENTSKDYYYILRLTDPLESVLVEYGFIDNSKDVAKLNSNLDSYVEGVVKAIADYLGIPYYPPGTTSSNIYTVKSGDTLYSIASKYKTTVDALKKLNNLTSNLLTIGQQLKLPAESNEGTTTNPSTTETYTVKSGDTLYSIASKYNTTVDALKKLNNLTSNILSIGQKLMIPSTSNTTNTYTVVSGDSLYSIAKKFNTSVDELKRLNNLTSNLLTINQVLKIPSSTNTVSIYTVQKGDSLWKIATENNITVDDLINANNLKTTTLSIGQQLQIPMNS